MAASEFAGRAQHLQLAFSAAERFVSVLVAIVMVIAAAAAFASAAAVASCEQPVTWGKGEFPVQS
jgi:hypothetical protein